MTEALEPLRREWRLLEERLGHAFADPSLLEQALTHRSYANESRDPVDADNERLEFLGDAVLDLAVGEALYRDRPDADEGELSRLRAELVSEPNLAEAAKALELGEWLRLGRGEARGGGRSRESILADALEAVIGAVFLDAGYAAARQAALRAVHAPRAAGAAPVGHDFKSRLQELLQARQRSRPDYRLSAARGPDHQRSYEVEVLVDGAVLGRGAGSTKKRAEQLAARQALTAIAGGSGDE